MWCCAVRRRSFAWLVSVADVDSGMGDGDEDDVIGRLNFLRCRILLTSVSLFRLFAAAAAAATAAIDGNAVVVGGDVVGMYVGRDRLRNGDVVVFRVVGSVASLISFD